jgi:hypothetical protein
MYVKKYMGIFSDCQSRAMGMMNKLKKLFFTFDQFTLTLLLTYSVTM